jgi:hypothetical protein
MVTASSEMTTMIVGMILNRAGNHTSQSFGMISREPAMSN